MVKIKITKPYELNNGVARMTLKPGKIIECNLENDYAIFYFGCCANKKKIILDPEYFEIVTN